MLKSISVIALLVLLLPVAAFAQESDEAGLLAEATSIDTCDLIAEKEEATSFIGVKKHHPVENELEVTITLSAASGTKCKFTSQTPVSLSLKGAPYSVIVKSNKKSALFDFNLQSGGLGAKPDTNCVYATVNADRGFSVGGCSPKLNVN